MFSRRILLALALQTWLAAHAVQAQSPDEATPTIIGREQSRAYEASLVGQWTCQIGRVRETLTMRPDGSFAFADR